MKYILKEIDGALTLAPATTTHFIRIMHSPKGMKTARLNPGAIAYLGDSPLRVQISPQSCVQIMPTNDDDACAIPHHRLGFVPVAPIIDAFQIPDGTYPLEPCGASGLQFAIPSPQAEPNPNAASWAPPEPEPEPEPSLNFTTFGITQKHAREIATLHQTGAEAAELLAIHPRALDILAHNKELFDNAPTTVGMPSVNYWKKFSVEDRVSFKLPEEPA